MVSGDIFHNGAPSSVVQTLFTKAVMRMHEASEDTLRTYNTTHQEISINPYIRWLFAGEYLILTAALPAAESYG